MSTLPQTHLRKATKRPISIIVRLRPFLSHETEDDTISFDAETASSVTADESVSTSVLVKNLRDPTIQSRYSFSAAHPATDTQGQLFQSSVHPLLSDILIGKNLTLFAYGVTGSGKTWTMVGESAGVLGGKKANSRSKYSDGSEIAGQNEGVTPRLVRWLISQKQEREMIRQGKKKKARSRKGQQQDEQKSKEWIDVNMECYEIYNEMVFDLLVKQRSASGLPVRENGEKKVFVAGLTSQPVESFADFLTLFETANSHRSTGATNLNAASSRSHMVVSLLVTVRGQQPEHDETQPMPTRYSSRVNLVDLAGSENNKLTGNNRERLTESSAINKSLFVLGQVVQALNQGASRIPYRDSKMTMIMRDALGGGTSCSHGVLVANLAPGSKFYHDTVATLSFASRTRTIENRVESNAHLPSTTSAATLTTATATAASVRSTSSSKSASASVCRANQRVAPLSASQPNPPATLKPLAMAALAKSASQPSMLGAKRVPLSTKTVNRLASNVSDKLVKPLPKHKGISNLTRIHPPSQQPETITEKSTAYLALEARLESLEKQLAEQQQQQQQQQQHTRSTALDVGTNAAAAALPALLSPSTRNKTAKAAVALARTAESQSGVEGLEEALGHYQQALLYAPDNQRLRARVEECKEAFYLGMDLKKLRAKRKREDKTKTTSSLSDRLAAAAGKREDTVKEEGEEEEMAIPVGNGLRNVQVNMLTSISVKPDLNETDDPVKLPSRPSKASQQPLPLSSGQHLSSLSETSSSKSKSSLTENDKEIPKAKRTTGQARRVVISTGQPRSRLKRDPDPETQKDSSYESHAENDSDSDSDEYLVNNDRALSNRRKLKKSKTQSESESEFSDSADNDVGLVEEEEPKPTQPLEEAEVKMIDLSRFSYVHPYRKPRTQRVPTETLHPITTTATTDNQKDEEPSDDDNLQTTTTTTTTLNSKKRSKSSSASSTSDLPKKKKIDIEPVDLSSVPMRIVRGLRICAFCGTEFIRSRTGPMRLKHLQQCAGKRQLKVSTAISVIEQEWQRIEEQRRNEEEQKTLFQQVLDRPGTVIVSTEEEEKQQLQTMKKSNRNRISNHSTVPITLTTTRLQPAEQTRKYARQVVERMVLGSSSSDDDDDAIGKQNQDWQDLYDLESSNDDEPTRSDHQFIHDLLMNQTETCSSALPTTQAFQPSKLLAKRKHLKPTSTGLFYQ